MNGNEMESGEDTYIGYCIYCALQACLNGVILLLFLKNGRGIGNALSMLCS